jgi:hypothetical protein
VGGVGGNSGGTTTILMKGAKRQIKRFTFPNHDDVRNLREIVANKRGHTINDATLVVQGKVLMDGDTLAKYGFPPAVNVSAIIRRLG